VPLGESSVIIAASARHRSEAFAGAREASARIQAEAPIWKREVEDRGGGVSRLGRGHRSEGRAPAFFADEEPAFSD
jgi:molybdopterin synthase catalytic subunit